MNRQQRRKIERENKKEILDIKEGQQWFMRLPDNRRRFIGYFIEKKIIESDNFVASIMNKCFQSAIDDNTELELIDQKKIIAESDGYIKEYKEYLEKYGEKEGFNMIENQETIKKIKERIVELMDNKTDKAKGLKILKSEFFLPNAELSDLWIGVRATKGRVSNPHTPKKFVDKEKEKYLNEVGQENEKILNKEVAADKEEIPNYAEGEIGLIRVCEGEHGFEMSNEEYLKLEVERAEFVNPNKPKLKVKSIEIEGEFGLYYKGANGVKLGDKLYNDKSIVEVEKNIYMEGIDKEKENILSEIYKLNKRLNDIDEEKKRELEKYAELEEVFNL